MKSIGEALKFYARFTPEVRTFWEALEAEDREQLRQDFFPALDMDGTRFDALSQRVNKLIDVADLEAGDVTNEFKNNLLRVLQERSEIIKPIDRKIRSQNPNWECKFWIEKKSIRTARKNIQVGMLLDDSSDTIYARSWIWVKGVENDTIYEAIRKSSPGFQPLSEYPEWAGSTNYSLLSNEKLLDAVERGDTTDLLVDRLIAPFRQINANTWGELLGMAKQ